MDWSNWRSLPEARPPAIASIVILPRNVSEARRWNFLNREIPFNGGPIRYWPANLARLAISDHLKNRERQTLVCF